MPPENPLQPIANLLRQVQCSIADLKTAIQGLNGSITVSPPKTPTVNWGKVSIGNVPTLIRPANPKRISIALVNSTAAIVYLGTNNTVTANTGSNPGFEILAQSAWSDDSYTGELWGVMAAGTSIITYWEE
jgi:hypothetical protein